MQPRHDIHPMPMAHQMRGAGTSASGSIQARSLQAVASRRLVHAPQRSVACPPTACWLKLTRGHGRDAVDPQSDWIAVVSVAYRC